LVGVPVEKKQKLAEDADIFGIVIQRSAKCNSKFTAAAEEIY